MRVLVTGANGYIGRTLVPPLLAAGHDIVAVSLDKEGVLPQPAVTYRQVDITDPIAVQRLFQGERFDALVHLAALVHVRSTEYAFMDYSRVNYRASERLFEHLRDNGGTRIVFTSTVEVYGETPTDARIDETARCNPNSDYARTKLLAEEVLNALAAKSSICHAILRLAPVYGPDFRLNLDKRFYLKPPNIGYYLGDGSYRLNLCSIRNVVSFIVHWLAMPEPTCGTFNLADDQAYPIRDWLDIERRHGRCKVKVRLPYSLCVAGAAALEALLAMAGRQPGMFTVGNVRKLVRSTVWDNSRARGILGSLPSHAISEE